MTDYEVVAAARSAEGGSVKKHRMTGSMLALSLGVLALVGGLGRLGSALAEGQTMAAEDASASAVSGLFMILGAVAYRSRKRRLLGLRPDTQGRVVFEIACLVLLTLAWLARSDLALRIEDSPAQYLLIPLLALAAYPCAGSRIRPATSDRQVAAPPWTGGLHALAIAFVLGSLGAAAVHALLPVQAVQPEPPRPPQGVLDAVRPLGLAVTMGQPFEVPGPDEAEWFVSVDCGIADGEARRLAVPTPGERWLFGVLWGDGSSPQLESRSYIQPVPKLTLSLSSTGGDVHEAAWAIFGKCPLSTERRLLPLWPEDAAMLIDGSGSAWIRADALGLPRDHPQLPTVRDSESFEELFESALPMALAFANGDLFIPVDGLVNGGPVFEVRDFVLDSNLSNVPSAADLIR